MYFAITDFLMAEQAAAMAEAAALSVAAAMADPAHLADLSHLAVMADPYPTAQQREQFPKPVPA